MAFSFAPSIVCTEDLIETMSHPSQNEQFPPEHHIILVWENGRSFLPDILADLQSTFTVLLQATVSWPEEAFEERLIGFYNNDAVRKFLPGKIERIGKGAFEVIVVTDNKPVYQQRETTHGPDNVNINLFDRKQIYRSWVGHNAIHGTDSEIEALRDLKYLADDLRSLLPGDDLATLNRILKM
jgi:nucleoside diphosphate kinase